MSTAAPANANQDSQETVLPSDLWGQFHIRAFASLTGANNLVERRELVWIKRFFAEAGRLDCYAALLSVLRGSAELNERELGGLLQRASIDISTADKRRFVYNVAQMCKSKGGITVSEYEWILTLSERLGIEDTSADSIINSVFSINDTFIAILGLLALGIILYSTRTVIVPLVIAIFMTMVINKVENLVAKALRLENLRWANKIGAMVVISGVVSLLVMAAIHSGREIAALLPHYETRLAAYVAAVEAFGAHHGIAPFSAGELTRRLQELPMASIAGNFFGSLINVTGNLVLVIVFTGFLVFSGSKFDGVLSEMNDKISAYVTVKSLAGVITGVAVYVLCIGFGIDFALFWATLVFLLNYIPAVGAIVASVPPVLLALIELDSMPSVLAFTGLMVLIQMVVGQVLEPKLMGDKLAINPIAILLGLIFWGFLWGLPGMFLAAPLMALLRILASYFNFSRTFERLLSTR